MMGEYNKTNDHTNQYDDRQKGCKWSCVAFFRLFETIIRKNISRNCGNDKNQNI